ncbi:hypothetical protein [Gracilibacillus kekensis]|uniref:Uncharacterized protein n=1 Tax=Gracilibacillus kekensis TaxID=1027249 RepID=A0A1M7NKW0_9BACI|nr:hypothetical protein [Gracilibacillus kekensis]SHN04501.1 hypothetical protein SAMN05216179_1608 [Gracilibacillus kekensis]
MKFEKTGLVVISFLFVFLIGISIWSIQPKEEVLANAIEVAEQQFALESKVQNKQVENFSLYLPEGYKVEEQNNSNLLLNKEEKRFILFYNELETQTSRLNYEAAKESNNHKWLEAFEEKERFGYINIKEREEGFEVELGVGGVKVTTRSSKEDLVGDVADMMDIANSIAYEETGA